MNGQLFTFYSYKGGTGRSFLLANVAWILASNGHRVLMVDWDLEAPGLHRYFHPFLKDQYLSSTPGVMDWFFDYQAAVAGLGKGVTTVPEDLLARLADPSPYVLEIDVSRFALANFGTLHLLPAGQQTDEYAGRVNRFNWIQLYENLGGAVFLERARKEMADQYDYVLIDSRTGVSDTSGISTLALPDKLVVCFTLNSQSVIGASNVANVAHDAHTKLDGEYDIFPVPTRVDRSEKLNLQIARQVAREAFAGFPMRLGSSAVERYWGEVEVPYESFYAYEEVLAPFGDQPGELTSILASSERLASFLTGHVVHLAPTEDAVRREILRQYLRRSDLAFDLGLAAERAFGQLDPEQQELARQLFLGFVFVRPDGVSAARSVRADNLPERLGPVLERFRSESVIGRAGAKVELGDPRLVSEWPRLSRWIEKDWDFIRRRSDLQVRLGSWLEARTDLSLLLPESLLNVAISWRDRRAAELADKELEFIATSQRHLSEERARQRQAEQERREQDNQMRVRTVSMESEIALLRQNVGLSSKGGPWVDAPADRQSWLADLFFFPAELPRVIRRLRREGKLLRLGTALYFWLSIAAAIWFLIRYFISQRLL